MSYSQRELREMFADWALWRINGGWHYAAPMESLDGVPIRAPGTHTDPTLSKIIGIENAGDAKNAVVDIYIRGLPRLRKALVYATFHDPLIDKAHFVQSVVERDFGISPQVYSTQMRKALDGLSEYLIANRRLAA